MKYNISDGVKYANGKNKDKQVKTQKYSYLIGYCFGEWIYEGAAYEENTRQYIFTSNITNSNYVTDYKGFRELIDKYDYPKRSK